MVGAFTLGLSCVSLASIEEQKEEQGVVMVWQLFDVLLLD